MTSLKNIAIAVASVVLFSNITYAQALKANYSVSYEEPLAVKYLGTDGEYLTFEVTMRPQIEGTALFEIDDKYEGQLYAANVTSALKVNRVKIEKRDDQVLNFKLLVGKKTYTKSFSVNTSKVEKTSVAESDITML
ncbi:MAG: hypothetical protein ABIN01_11730 [Ferruginibacter sp.]